MREMLLITSILFLIAITPSSSRGTYNLPDTTLSIHYEASILIQPTSDKFGGNVTLTLNMTQSTSTIQIRAHRDSIYLYNIVKINENETLSCKLSRATNSDQYIQCPEDFLEGIHTLSFQYTSSFGKDGKGLYKSYYLENGNNETIIGTNLMPSYASRLFPSLDEPKFIAKFDISVIHPADYTAWGNMPVVSKQGPDDEGLVITTFATTPKMSTYGLALMLAKVDQFSKSDTLEFQDSDLTVYLRPSRQQSGRNCRNLQYAVDMFKLLKTYTNMSYSSLGNNQINLIAVPNLPLPATVTWGTIFFEESYLLGDDQSAEHKQEIIQTLARQIAHQYFGMYITVDWWNQYWIHLGLSTYFEYFLPDNITDLGLQLPEQYVANIVQPSLEEDSYYLPALERSLNAVQGSYQIELALDNWLKAASIIHMLSNFIGKLKLQEGIQRYLKEYGYDPTTTSKTCAALADEWQCAMFETYLVNSGYPLVTLSLRDNETVQGTQDIFSLIDLNKTRTVYWDLPLTYISNAPNKTIHIKPKLQKNYVKETPFLIGIQEGAFMVMNINQTSYYRVNYDAILWQRIIDAMNQPDMSNIPVLSRAGLIDDILNIARAGKVDYNLVFKLVAYLKSETEYFPWKSYFRGMSYMMEHFSNLETVELLREISLQWFNQAIPDMNHKIDDIHLNILRDTFLNEWKCALEDENCLQYVSEAFQNFKNTLSFSNNNQMYLILCNGLKVSSDPENDFNFLWELTKNTTSQYLRRKYLQSLACVSTQDLQARLLSELIVDEIFIDKTEGNIVINAVIENRNNGPDSVITFLEENLEVYATRYNGYVSFPSIITSISKKLNDVSKLENLINVTLNDGQVYDIDALNEQTNGYCNMNKFWDETFGGAIQTILQEIKVKNFT